MGPEKFQQGVHRYLLKYEWKNATSAEFLAALAGDDSNLASAFSSFLDQPGVPLVTAQLACHDGAAQLDLTQQRFFPLGSSGASAAILEGARVRALSGRNRRGSRMHTARAEVALNCGSRKPTGCPGWVEANAGANGYYRVLYQGDLLDDLLKNNAQELSLPEKVALIDDLAALTRNGKMPLGKALALAPAFARSPARQVVTKTMEITAGFRRKPGFGKLAAPLPAVSSGSLRRPGARLWAGRRSRVRAKMPASSVRGSGPGWQWRRGPGGDRGSEKIGARLARRS